MVWTAGHCVFPEGGTKFATNWAFVPAYHEGAAPYGEWPAKRLATTGPWEAAGNIKYDLGAAVVRTSPTAGKLQNVIGARGIGFDQPRAQTYQAYGYPAPATLEFTGEREFRCTARSAATTSRDDGAADDGDRMRHERRIERRRLDCGDDPPLRTSYGYRGAERALRSLHVEQREGALQGRRARSASRGPPVKGPSLRLAAPVRGVRRGALRWV